MLEPLFDNIVVKPEAEKKSVGGIDLPDTVDPDAPQKGTVSYRGPESSVDVGSSVIFRKYAPDAFTYEGVKYLLLSQKDVIAIVR